MLSRHPILHKIEDLADSPLIPALLEKVYAETDPVIMKVGAISPFETHEFQLLSAAVQGDAEIRKRTGAVPPDAYREPNRARPYPVRHSRTD